MIPLEEEAAWVADALGPPSGRGGSYTSAMRTPKRNEELVVAGGDVHSCIASDMSIDTGTERHQGATHRPSLLITPRFWNTQRRRVPRLGLSRRKGNASPTSAGAHGRPDGSQWRVVLGTRRSVQGRGRQSRCPSPDNRHARGKNRGAAPKDTLGGRRGERAPGWVRASTRREDHTRPYQGPHTMCSAVLFRPGSGAGARPRTCNTNIVVIVEPETANDIVKARGVRSRDCTRSEVVNGIGTANGGIAFGSAN